MLISEYFLTVSGFLFLRSVIHILAVAHVGGVHLKLVVAFIF